MPLLARLARVLLTLGRAMCISLPSLRGSSCRVISNLYLDPVYTQRVMLFGAYTSNPKGATPWKRTSTEKPTPAQNPDRCKDETKNILRIDKLKYTLFGSTSPFTPHLYTLHTQSPVGTLTPARVPQLLAVPEGFRGRWTCIGPRLV